MSRVLWSVAVSLSTLTSAALADDVTSRRIVDLRVSPPAFDLSSATDVHRVVVQAEFDDGSTRDVTSDALLSICDATIARVVGREVMPKGDGSTELRVDYGGRAVTAPVVVANADRTPAVRFRLDVMPALTASGCNSGSCHGSSRGQDGFSLSLFGFDPAGDYHRITRQQVDRRINRAFPRDSLLLTKGTGAVPHTGGQLFSRDDPSYHVLLDWIEAGAPDDPPDLPQPIAIDIYPNVTVLGDDSTQQMVVVARYSDGTDRDVTHLSAFFSSDANAATVDRDGTVASHARGETQITARFATFLVGTPVLVLPSDLPATANPTRLAVGGDDDSVQDGSAQPTPSDEGSRNTVRDNLIDRHVSDKLRRLRIAPSPLCDDATFLRRASIDITGTLPTPSEVRAFLADESPDKRTRLIDALLTRPEFTELWVMKWSELLQIRTDEVAKVSYKGMQLYADWLRDRIARNVPIDEVVRELLTTSGGTFEDPPTNFYQIETDTLKLTENVAQVFLGTRIQCAQCHNHPFDRWTMNDYYGFAAFFAQVGRKQAQDPRETIIFDSQTGDVKHPVTGAVMAPRFLGGDLAEVDGSDRRRVVGDWLTSADNPFFARNLVNVIWAHFFGRGIVDPVDDVRVTNPPSHPQLLDDLSARFVTSGYDFRALVRDICTTETYQRSSVANDSNRDDVRNFSRATVRRNRAEILLDAIAQVTETPNKFKGLPSGSRATQITDGAISNYFLDTFGRATRTTVCSCEVQMEPSLSQALHLINGDSTAKRIHDGGVVVRQIESGAPPADIIEDLYLRCLGRPPNASELEPILGIIVPTYPDEPTDPNSRLEDLFWALLNSKEFLFNR